MQAGHQVAIGVLVAAFICSAASPGAAGPRTRPAADPHAAERAKWENIVTFFGEEDTGNYSIRILDRFVTEPAEFKYLELWIYDVKEKAWVKIDDREQSNRIVLPKDKPPDSPDNQLLADIPVTNEKVGLYYAKWQVNGIDCATMTRIGPGPVGKKPDLGKIPDGMIAADVPVDKNHGERMLVPDPRTHTGQAAK